MLPSVLKIPGFVERFRASLPVIGTINHPGVVRLFECVVDQAVGASVVTEYVEADPLSETLARVGRLIPARTMALTAQAADALHVLHKKRIVDCNVEPGSLLVGSDGKLVLAGFGISRSLDAGEPTGSGSVRGGATYMSPEQAMAEPATPASDLYALGVVAYECLAGRPPFAGDDSMEVGLRHVREAPPPLPPDIPRRVRMIVERAMHKNPDARWPSGRAFAQIARQAVADYLATRPPPPTVD